MNYTNKVYDGTAQNIRTTFEYPFKLVLAKRTPQNTPTNGINRVDWSNNEVFNQYGMKYSGNDGVSIEELLNTAKWDPTNYYNIYVVPKFDGGKSTLNGYAYYPQNHGSHLYDHTVLGSHVVNVGHATLGHEVGHALGLQHVFGNPSGDACDPNGDGVDDTSPTPNGNYYYSLYRTQEPVGLINKCTNEVYDDIIWNVLNYGSQPRVILTEGQTNRSLALFQQYRTSFLTSLVTLPPSATSSSPVSSCSPQNITGVSTLEPGRGRGRGMTLVNFGTINNQTDTHYGPTPVFYHDYTQLSHLNSNYTTEVVEGEKVELRIGNKTPNQVKYVVYIDYNNDGEFQSNEMVVNNLRLNSSGFGIEATTTTVIEIPKNAIKNTPLRMRVIGDLSIANFDACADRYDGEVEDYTVIIRENPVTIWDGTSWSNGVPTEEKEAIVKGDLIIDESNPIVADKFTLESGSVLVNSYIKVNQITNNLSADKFVIKGAGVYQIGENAEANGEFTVIQNSSPMILNDATLWASPVTGQNLRNFSPNTLLKRFYKYNETTNKFASLFVDDPLYPNPSLEDSKTYNFETGVGYHIRAAANQSTTVASEFEGKFVGLLNNGEIRIPVTKNNYGYNLVGNPYPSSINADLFFDKNPNVSTLYFWTQESPLTSNGYASNNYASYTKIGKVPAETKVQPNGIISKGQGFFVQVTGGENVVFDNSLRTIPTAPIEMHKGESTKRIWIDFVEGVQTKNQILVAYANFATNDIDHQIDGQFNSMYSGSKIYSLINESEEQFVIQGRDLSTIESDLVKIGFEAKTKGTFTIKIAKTENLSNQSIYLRDKLDNQIVDLVKASYSFDSEEGIYNDRFELIYSTQTLNTIETLASSNIVNVVKTSSGLKIKSNKELSSVDVYDLTGRKVLSTSVNGTEYLITNLPKSNQVLVFKVKTKDTEINTIKIVY